MKMLKGKVEAYVISTMEDNQRTSLLDNLAISVEKLEDEANNEMINSNEKAINEGDILIDFIDCLLAILNHELRNRRAKLKPSFWYVAESISPKDTIQAIYRLKMQQSDKTRCQAWLRYALREGSLGSYLSILCEDSALLKEFYKAAAFVRDVNKMDSAKSLISFTITSIVFNINIEPRMVKPKAPFQKNFINGNIAKENIVKSPNRKKTRGGSVNIAVIADSDNINEDSEYAYHFSTDNSMETSPNSSRRSESSNSSGHGRPNADSNSPEKKFDLQDSINEKTIHFPESSQTQEIDNKESFSEGTMLAFESPERYDITMSEVNMSLAKSLCSMDGEHENTLNNSNIAQQSASATQLSISRNFTDSINKSEQTESLDNVQPETLLETVDRKEDSTQAAISQINNDSNLVKMFADNMSSITDSNSDNYLIHDNLESRTNKNTLENDMAQETFQPKTNLDNTVIKKETSSFSYKEDQPDHSEVNDGLIESTSPKIAISGSLNHSADSLFQCVSKINKDSSVLLNFSSDMLSNSCSDDIYTNDITKVFTHDHPTDNQSEGNNMTGNVAKNSNATDKSSEHILNESFKTPQKVLPIEEKRTAISPIESDYLNQKEQYDDDSLTEVAGSSQLSNILNSSEYSPKDTYFVPGIHCNTDIKKDKRTYTLPSKMSQSFETTATLRKDRQLQRSSTIGNTSWDMISSANLNYFDDSESDSCSTSDQSSSLLADLGVTDDFIGLKENHFSDSFMGFSSSEELENAIATCKQLIKEAPTSQRKKDLVIQLVNLRLKLHEDKEKTGEKQTKTTIRKILGHHFVKQAKVPSTMICDSCGVTIFPLLQTVYMCKDCGFHCHRKCLKQLEKPCVSSSKLSSSNYELRICPVSLLSKQDYRCADCRKRFTLSHDSQFDCRICDYSGMYFCTLCHWNEQMVIPARVIHNWDFTPHKVSRQSKHTLLLMRKKPNINLKNLNPSLFNFVDELRDTRTLREQILKMKKYVMSCRIATEERLLLTLQQRQHFVDNSDFYSLQDLLDLNSNILLDELTHKHTTLAKHIKMDCMLCQGQGFICELCKSNEIIYPFDQLAYQCKCNATFHRQCYFNSDKCPKCERDEKRKSNRFE